MRTTGPLLLLLSLLLLPGCAWVSAKTLSPEQLQGMKEIMAIEGVVGCFGAGGSAAFATAEVALRGGVCRGVEPKPTIDEIIQLMNGISVTVKAP